MKSFFLQMFSAIVMIVVCSSGSDAALSKDEGSDGKWQQYASDEEESQYFYDPKGVQKVSPDLMRVWVRVLYSEKKPKLKEASLLWEINCPKKSMRGISGKSEDKDGTTRVINDPSEWANIPDESTAETLHELVCGKKSKKSGKTQ